MDCGAQTEVRMITEARDRLSRHRDVFGQRDDLRALYADWYGRIRDVLPDSSSGVCVELGSGPGLIREFIPHAVCTDVVPASWLDLRLSAQSLPFAPTKLGALILFDVLHHLPAPGLFFEEAARALQPGGRLVMCEPFVSWLSWPVYRFFHEEALDFDVDALSQCLAADKDPFAGNQAVPTQIFFRQRARFEQRFPEFRILETPMMAGPSYPLSGGFGRRAPLPNWLWRRVHRWEQKLPAWLYRVLGFRMMIVLERTDVPARRD
jgi:SAM-dependent methyltransferase